MCLILMAWRTHPRYCCIIAANRDEFHDRPAAAAAWWPESRRILAGRDLTAGGTWLGLTRTGRFAALTNFRSPQALRTDAPSRGILVSDWLESDESVPQGLARLQSESARYNGFNLLFSDGARLGVHESMGAAGRELKPGIYGLSNHRLDTPWRKLQRAKAGFARAIDAATGPHELLTVLRDEQPTPDEELPSTGVGLDLERLLSRSFIRSPHYGTRCSTVVRIETTGTVLFDEWSWTPDGNEAGRSSLQFTLQVP